ncbi:ribosomal RNA small subunit methyltransferase A [Candidatus Saccharibacteria bacterium]|nr:ribosomal RNA small subunit methyltransferase A [Candidatus Saccharibacteria bacterium]MBR0424311.1 ribosomal RNA small subunit methyltransferase A [Candidatus Saccharibacteria bacterium]
MTTNKALGQHWLQNREILNEIADLARFDDASVKNASVGDFKASHGLCVEIGPGLGTLTASLLKRFKKVLAVEFDAKLAANLPGSFPGTSLEVINADILKFDFSQIKEPYAVAGNIPYYITSPIIEKILTASNPPEKVVLLMQKEVAERICSEKESVLSLFVKNYAEVELGPVVPKEEFSPAPKVDSQVLILAPFKDGPKYPTEVMELIKRAFKNPRKKLKHNLPNVPEKYANLRPENLHLNDYCAIMKSC